MESIEITTAAQFVAMRSGGDTEAYQQAAHAFASEDIWLEVVARYPEMKSDVIWNKNVPVSVLALLAKDPDADLRAQVAGKRKLSREIFELLSRDVDPWVRRKIAGNPKAPAEILERLQADSVEYVRERAEEALEKRRGGS
jgi:hypothetical protein